MNDQQPITQEDALSALKIAFHALIRSGMSGEEIISQANEILRGLVDADEITLLSMHSLGLVKDSYISELGNIRFDTMRNTILYKDQRVKLSPNESLMMGIFINNPGKLLTHQEIADHVVGDYANPPAEVCRPIISRLRKALSTFPGGEKWIETIRGKGYVLKGDRNI